MELSIFLAVLRQSNVFNLTFSNSEKHIHQIWQRRILENVLLEKVNPTEFLKQSSTITSLGKKLS